MEKEIIIKRIKYILIGVLVLIFQAEFANNLRIFGVAPNFVLCYVMCMSFHSTDSFGFYNALIMGLCADALGGRIFGEYTFFFVLFDFLIGRVFYKLFSENFIFEFLGGAIFNFVFSFSFALIYWLFGGRFWFLLTEMVLAEVIYNSAVFMVFLWISRKTKKKRHITFRINE